MPRHEVAFEIRDGAGEIATYRRRGCCIKADECEVDDGEGHGGGQELAILVEQALQFSPRQRPLGQEEQQAASDEQGVRGDQHHPEWQCHRVQEPPSGAWWTTS